MIADLQLRNLAVVEEAHLRLGRGLNVLSGETGAGKSIVVDALILLAGGRATADAVRTGATGLSVVGSFILNPDQAACCEAAGISVDPDEPLLVRREVGRDGRSRAFLNDQPVTVRRLAELVGPLVRVHTQREEASLSDPRQQRDWLDRAGGDAAPPLLAATAAAARRHREVLERWRRWTGDQRDRAEREALLRFTVEEIGAVAPRPGEDRVLRERREVLRNLEAVRAGLSGAVEELHEAEGSVEERIGRAQRLLEGIADWQKQTPDWLRRLHDTREQLRELVRELRSQGDSLEREPESLDAVEERLTRIERLIQRFGGSLEAVLERQHAAEAELSEASAAAEGQERLRADLERAHAAYREAAGRLGAARRGWARELAGRMHEELAELALGKARLEVAFATMEADDPGTPVPETGTEEVTFLLSANPGEEARPLARVASGGELSRVYLALQLAVRNEGAAGDASLVFDEIDTGIGGAEAAALGGKLQRLARGGQILVVTHSPQVASHGDLHLRVEKEVAGGRTRVRVLPLEGSARVDEIARMLAGSEVTRLSRSHAAELMAAAENAAGVRRAGV